MSHERQIRPSAYSAILDTYWYEYMEWCMDQSKVSLVSNPAEKDWPEERRPAIDDFWSWYMTYKFRKD